MSVKLLGYTMHCREIGGRFLVEVKAVLHFTPCRLFLGYIRPFT